MRARSFAAIVVLLLPAVMDAQGGMRPRIGVRGPRGTPIPQRPPIIAREMSYTRLNFTVEAYPILSRVEAPGIAGGWASSYTMFGTGTRAEYALARYMAATADLTSSFIGGPRTETLELGTRLRPPRSESKVYPFLDLRVGYMYMQHSSLRQIDFTSGIGAPIQSELGDGYSHGVGSVAGAGVEYALTNTLSLTTAGSVMQSRLTRYAYGNQIINGNRFTSTWFRYTIGLRYNPVRFAR